MAIGGQSQQDAFTDRELVGFAVTTTTPACSSIINTQPVDFVINLSDPADPSSVQASDFTVNGTPANSFVLSNGNATITFHFNSSPVVTQGLQTMHIPAGAFNRASDNQANFEFNCTFCYAVMPLQVTTTDPPVGGTFSPPAPGDYQYDVNFNQAVDPASVQTSDLTLTGNVGGSVTAVQRDQRKHDCPVHVAFQFRRQLDGEHWGRGDHCSIGCNPNAAFSGNYTVEGCPPADHYDIAQIGGSIVPGTTDIGNHADDTVTTIALPFPYTLYDQSYNSINLSSNGNAQLRPRITRGRTLARCRGSPTTTPSSHTGTTSARNRWRAARVSLAELCGIFTSITGSAPNRIFNIEWRAVYFANTARHANHELRLYEVRAASM